MLTVKEVANKLCVENETIRSYIRNGIGKDREKLTAIKVRHGRRLEWRIKLEDLEYFKNKYLS